MENTQNQSRQEPVSLQYSSGFKLIFADENRWMNLLLASIYTIIPILGPVALMGWHCEIFHRLNRGEVRQVPRLDFGDIIYFFKRGLVPFVMGLAITLPIVILVFLNH